MAISDVDFHRPPELDSIAVHYYDDVRWVTCFCSQVLSRSIVPHLKKDHPEIWAEWTGLFVRLRGAGYPPKRIMRTFSDGNGDILFSWTVVERAVRDAVESGAEVYAPPRKSVVNEWVPQGFQLETTTVWDFPRRGSWAVHKGDFRGNWPPQLVRNLIQKYTREGDLIVDPFMGGGTSLLEAWLLRRRSVGLDLSRLAVQTTRGRLGEMEDAASGGAADLEPGMKPVVLEENALKLREAISGLGADYKTVSLVCVHPPYLNALQYTKDNEHDLSRIVDPLEFTRRIGLFAKQVYGLLEPGGYCAVLMGDVRKDGKLVPLGYDTLNQFVRARFDLQDIIIKTQHHDRSTEFYVRNNSRLLLSHEYLFILKKRVGA